MSRMGRISTWLPGKNAVAPSKSTVKPPLTRPNIMPCTRSPASKDFCKRTQLSSRRALSRDNTASPIAFSICSRKTSTSSPTLTLICAVVLVSRLDLGAEKLEAESEEESEEESEAESEEESEEAEEGAPSVPVSCVEVENSRRAMRPSVFKPTSTMTKSFSMAVMRPLTTVPSKLF